MSHTASSVCLWTLCKSSWTDCEPVWDVDSRRPSQPCIRRGPHLTGRGNFEKDDVGISSPTGMRDGKAAFAKSLWALINIFHPNNILLQFGITACTQQAWSTHKVGEYDYSYSAQVADERCMRRNAYRDRRKINCYTWITHVARTDWSNAERSIVLIIATRRRLHRPSRPSPTIRVAMDSLSQQTATFLFFNNSVENQAILTIFGAWNPEKIWHQHLTAPHL